jgi:endonuclease III
VARSYVHEARRRVGPKRTRIRPIIERLAAEHPDATIALRFGSPLELLVSVMLSAQTTDTNVNRVTERLFVKYRSPEDYLAVSQEELERDIFATGFFRQKTKSLRGTMRMLIDEFDGRVPGTIDELLRLPGVARKTANVVSAELGRPQGLVVDTHVRRLSQRLGLTRQEDPVKIERDLIRLVPREDWGRFPHLLIWHGRRVCDARRPACERCVVNDLCPSSRVDVEPFFARQVANARDGEDDGRRDEDPGGRGPEGRRQPDPFGKRAGEGESERLQADAQDPVDRRDP